MRVIDADALEVQFKRAIETYLPNDPRKHMTPVDSLKCHGWEQGLMVIQEAPTIQPKRGRWIEDKGQQTLMKNFIEMGEVWRVCSVCGAGHMIGHKYAIDKAYHDRHHNFCPNCGAKMEVTNGN